jgi:hypothetical protein
LDVFFGYVLGARFLDVFLALWFKTIDPRRHGMVMCLVV